MSRHLPKTHPAWCQRADCRTGEFGGEHLGALTMLDRGIDTDVTAGLRLAQYEDADGRESVRVQMLVTNTSYADPHYVELTLSGPQAMRVAAGLHEHVRLALAADEEAGRG